MAMPVVIAKNQTGTDIDLDRLGLRVPASGQTTLTDSASYTECTEDASLETAVTSGDIVINDGNSDLSTAEALGYLASSGNLDGPVSGSAANVVPRLKDATGRYTLSSGVTIDNSDNIVTPGTITSNGSLLLSEDAHAALRQLIHFIDSGPAEGFVSGAFHETLPTGRPFPTSYIWWESASKLQKIVELTLTRSQGGGKPLTEEWKMYDTDGTTVLVTVTDTITYSGPFESTRTRVIA